MGSPFASLTNSRPIALPFDPSHHIVVRKLTGREYEQAQESHARGVAVGRSRMWSENFRQILEKGLVATAELQKALKDPLTGFDRYAVVTFGLVGWSYPQLITVPEGQEKDGAAGIKTVVEVNRQIAIDDLDDEAVEFIAREVMRLTKPALFQTDDEQETERKND